MSSWQDYSAYLNQFDSKGNYVGLPSMSPLDRASGKASALGLPNAEGESGPGLLQRILSPLDIPRGLVYATLTSDGSGEDWMERFNRARYEGEGFGKVGALRVEEGDDLITKALKFGGSFAADVVSDPINWVTFGGATMGKVAVAGLTKSVGRKALGELPEVVAKRAGKTLGDDVVEKFAVDQLVKNGVDDAPSVLRSILDDPARGRAAVEDLAADRLGDIIVTGRVAGTARTSRSYLADALKRAGVDGADEIAGDVVTKQVREISGGMRLEVPFTRLGVSLTKGGGLGTDAVGLGRAADAANEARLAWRKAINRPGSIKRKFSGETGGLYGDMLNDLRELGVEALYVPGRTTAGSVSKFVRGRNAGRIAADNFGMIVNTAVQSAQSAINDFGDQAVARAIVNAAFDGSKVELDNVLRNVNPADPRVQRLVEAGRNARRVWVAEAEALGMEPDPNYVPRIFSTEQAKINILENPDYAVTDPSKARIAYDDLVLQQVDDEGTVNLVRQARSNMEINAERATRGKGKMFEDDMFIILAKRGEIARARVEAAVQLREWENLGIIKNVGKSETLGETYNTVNKAIAQVFNKHVKRAERLAEEAFDARAANRRANAIRAAARVDGDVARQVMEDDLKVLREALAETRKRRKEAKTAVRKAQEALVRATGQYKKLGTSQGKQAEKARVARNKARKALKKAEEAAAEAKVRVVQAEADYAAAKEAPRTGSEAARLAERLPGQQRRLAAREASVVKRQADLDAADQAVKDVGNVEYDFVQADMKEVMEETLETLRSETELGDVLDRVGRRQSAKIKKQNAELMSARYGTAAERRADDLVEKTQQASKAIESKIDANRKGGDVVTEYLDTINGLLSTEKGWEQADELLTELIDTMAAGGASQFDIDTLKSARDAVRRIPVIREKQAAISALTRQNYGFIASEVGANVPESFTGYMGGQGVRDAIIRLNAANNQTEGVIDALREYVTPVMRVFRTYATVGRGPGYIARNGVGGIVNNWLAGVSRSRYPLSQRIEGIVHRVVNELNDEALAGKIDPANLVKVLDERLAKELSWKADDTGVTAFQLVRGFLDQGVQYNRATDAMERSVFEALAGRNATIAERRMTLNPTRSNLVAEQQGIGVMRSTAEKISTNQALLDNAWVRLWGNTAERQEFLMRMAAYAEGQARYGDEVSAGLFAKSLHFDYRDLTNSEKNIKFMVPFYTWTRYNLPYQMRAAINNPGSLKRLEAFSNNMALAFGSEEEGGIPEWLEDRLGFLTDITLPGGGKLALGMESPQLGLFEWSSGNPGSEVLSSVNPLVKAFFELSTGRDVATGAPSGPFDVVTDVVPPVGLGMRLLGVREKDRERLATSWLSFFGVPAVTVTPKQQESITKRKAAEVNARVQAALAPYLAEGEEIDTDWLIEMGNRYTPEQVIMFVAQGYGRRGNLDPTKPKRPRRRSTGPSAGTRAAQNIDPASLYLSQFLGG